MTLKQIIDDLNARLHHTLTEDDIVRYANRAASNASRVAAKRDMISFLSAARVGAYPLPSYVKPEGIKTVTVGGSEYLPKGLNERARGNMYFVSPDGFIHFSPIPKDEREVFIVYEGVMEMLTFDEIKELNPELDDIGAREMYEGQNPGIDDEYSMLIPLSIAAEAAQIMEDINLSNNYRMQYNWINVNKVDRKKRNYSIIKSASL